MKIMNFEVPTSLIAMAAITVGFCLGIAVGVKTALMSMEDKIKRCLVAHPDPADFKTKIEEMFVGQDTKTDGK